MINYNNRILSPVSNSENGEVTEDVKFHFRQEAKIVSASYSGGSIVSGHLIALADETGKLDMRYHHINANGEIMTGTCISTPEQLPDGRLRLLDKWQWTCGDFSKGESVLEEK